MTLGVTSMPYHSCSKTCRGIFLVLYSLPTVPRSLSGQSLQAVQVMRVDGPCMTSCCQLLGRQGCRRLIKSILHMKCVLQVPMFPHTLPAGVCRGSGWISGRPCEVPKLQQSAAGIPPRRICLIQKQQQLQNGAKQRYSRPLPQWAPAGLPAVSISCHP